jgi:hypothetical protein
VYGGTTCRFAVILRASRPAIDASDVRLTAGRWTGGVVLAAFRVLPSPVPF